MLVEEWKTDLIPFFTMIPLFFLFMVILRLSDIAKRFGPTVALDGVNLQLRRGEVHALIGENGAGKSTLMNILAGGLWPDRGEMEVDGRPDEKPRYESRERFSLEAPAWR